MKWSVLAVFTSFLAGYLWRKLLENIPECDLLSECRSCARYAKSCRGKSCKDYKSDVGIDKILENLGRE